MPPWSQLEVDLAVWLKTFARPGLEFKGPHQAIPGFPFDGFRSDGVLTDGKVLLAIEVEAGQMHPDTNVGKYWLLASYKRYKRIVLFHIYTPEFDSYGWRKALGEFYVEKMRMEVPIDYIQLDCRKASDYETTLAGLRSEIAGRLRQEFSSG